MFSILRADEEECFCLTDGEGGEEVGAEGVRVEGEAVVDEGCAVKYFHV